MSDSPTRAASRRNRPPVPVMPVMAAMLGRVPTTRFFWLKRARSKPKAGTAFFEVAMPDSLRLR